VWCVVCARECGIVVLCVIVCFAARTWRVKMSRSQAQLVQLSATHIEPFIALGRELKDRMIKRLEISVPQKHNKELKNIMNCE
jgi:hypothetical protein